MSDRPIAAKLRLKPGRLLLVQAPAGYAERLQPLPEGLSLVTESAGPVQAIQLFVADRAALEKELPRLKPLLAPGGMLWVCYHKGTSRVATDINRDSIWAYARSIGMDAVAQVAIDDDWSAMRLKVA
ncbi:MAG: hypothetical protein GX557_11340 [Chloroflexi bacterium]|nr:hypothetical protein [Chloroflexota bacterium]